MKTVEEIYAEMCETFKTVSGLDVNDGCDMAVRLYAAAAQVYSLYAYNDWVKNQCFPQTASGEYLDNHAGVRGIERSPAAKAKGTIRFYMEEAREVDITISSGTVCLTGGGQRFITLAEAVITAGELFADAEAEAAEAGAAGNVSAGMIVFMAEAPVGVCSCTNVQRFTGGTDAESDESLRERVMDSFKRLPNGANTAYYEKEVLAVNGVAAVKVLPKERGIGTVDIVISGHGGLPEEELIDEVSTKLNEKREICVDIKVSAPETLAVDIEASIDIEDGYEFESVKAAVTAAVEDYFDGEILGCDILRAKLGDIIFGVAGVKNYSIAMPETDISAERAKLPQLNTLAVNSWS